jgi:hypothetical protein
VSFCNFFFVQVVCTDSVSPELHRVVILLTFLQDSTDLPDPFIEGTFRIAKALAEAKNDPSALLTTGATLADGVYVLAVVDAIRASQGNWVNVGVPGSSKL